MVQKKRSNQAPSGSKKRERTQIESNGHSGKDKQVSDDWMTEDQMRELRASKSNSSDEDSNIVEDVFDDEQDEIDHISDKSDDEEDSDEEEEALKTVSSSKDDLSDDEEQDEFVEIEQNKSNKNNHKEYQLDSTKGDTNGEVSSKFEGFKISKEFSEQVASELENQFVDGVYLSDDDNEFNESDLSEGDEKLSEVESEEDEHTASVEEDEGGVQILESYKSRKTAEQLEREEKIREEKEEKKKSLFDDVENDDDSSEDEGDINTIGNVPMKWYDEYDHIGYDKNGKKIIRKKRKDELDNLIARADDPNFLRTVYDEYNDRDVVLSNKDLKMLIDIQKGKFPSFFNPYRDYVDYVKVDNRFPLAENRRSKKSFTPNADEIKIINKLVQMMNNGEIRMPSQVEKEKKEKKKQALVYKIWGDDGQLLDDVSRRGLLLPPKIPLPGHEDSYNPPGEYIEDGMKRYKSMKDIPMYQNYIQEVFERCFDLYMAPRVQRKKKPRVDPDSLLPDLPNPSDLRPFPEIHSLTYFGHEDIIRSISIDPSGMWVVSGSSDGTVRLWEGSTGRCMRVWKFEDDIQWVEWNPNKKINLLAVATDNYVYLVQPPETGDEESNAITEKLFPDKGYEEIIEDEYDDEIDVKMDLKKKENEEESDDDQKDVEEQKNVESATKTGRKKVLLKWTFYRKEEDYVKRVQGILVKMEHLKRVKQVTWHPKGDYFSSLSPTADNDSIVIHQLSTRSSQKPFKKKIKRKGIRFVRIMFHPSKPLFFVATQYKMKVYDLMKQKLFKKMKGQRCKYISSFAVHPTGQHILTGGYDKRTEWYEMDVSSRPYKSMKYHSKAVRQVEFHKKYPLFATCSDDGTIQIFHCSVFDDWLKDPLLVPLKILKGHATSSYLGVLDIKFHPTQPWIYSCGADQTIRLYTS